MEILVGLLQILTLLRGWILTFSTAVANAISVPLINIQTITYLVLSLILAGQISKIFPDNKKMWWVIGFTAALYYLLKYYGLK